MDFSRIKDELEKADILITENLLEDAKKILRKILIHHPDEIPAKRKLEEIQKREIEALLSKNNSNESVKGWLTKKEDSKIIDSWIFAFQKELDEQNSKIISELFESQSKYEEYKKSILLKLKELSFQDRKELAIAFLTLELDEISINILETINHNSEFEYECNCLIAFLLIRTKRYGDAIQKCEVLLQDPKLDETQKTNIHYLMGTALEKLGEKKKSREFFKKVFNQNPRYKDIAGKMK